jgi:hypothetical protein
VPSGNLNGQEECGHRHRSVPSLLWLLLGIGGDAPVIHFKGGSEKARMHLAPHRGGSRTQGRRCMVRTVAAEAAFGSKDGERCPGVSSRLAVGPQGRVGRQFVVELKRKNRMVAGLFGPN